MRSRWMRATLGAAALAAALIVNSNMSLSAAVTPTLGEHGATAPGPRPVDARGWRDRRHERWRRDWDDRPHHHDWRPHHWPHHHDGRRYFEYYPRHLDRRHPYGWPYHGHPYWW